MANTNALCAVSDVLSESPDLNSSTVDSLIDSISEAFEVYCQRVFLSHAVVEKISGNGRQELQPSAWPIASSPAPVVKIDDETITDFELTGEGPKDPNRYFFREQGWPKASYVHADLTFDPIAGKGKRNVTLEYTGGFATVPADLKRACIEEVIAAANAGSRDDNLKAEKTPGGWDQEFFDPRSSTSAFSVRTRSTLNRYMARFYA